MKNSLITLLLFLSFLKVTSQGLYFDVHGAYNRPVKKESLQNAKILGDFIKDYPASWVSEYVSVVVLTTNNGRPKKALSRNDALTAEQQNILRSADLASEVAIRAKYKSINAATNETEVREIYISATVVPEVEAEFIGGNLKLRKYFDENVMFKISNVEAKDFHDTSASFTINEEGEVVNTKITQSSGNPDTDTLIIDAINKMSQWKPAENFSGKNVKQEFVFTVSAGGC